MCLPDKTAVPWGLPAVVKKGQIWDELFVWLKRAQFPGRLTTVLKKGQSWMVIKHRH